MKQSIGENLIFEVEKPDLQPKVGEMSIRQGGGKPVTAGELGVSFGVTYGKRENVGYRE